MAAGIRRSARKVERTKDSHGLIQSKKKNNSKKHVTDSKNLNIHPLLELLLPVLTEQNPMIKLCFRHQRFHCSQFEVFFFLHFSRFKFT